MNWKQTKISYFFWILYMAFAGLALWQVCTEFCKPMGIQEPVIWGILGGVLLLGGLFSMLIWFLRSKWLPELKGNILFWTIPECLLFLGILAGGIYLRLQKLPLAQGGLLYSMAEMKYQMPLPETIHMGENLYLQILHGFCYLLGNTPYFCIRFHLILTILTGIVWFFGVRGLSNDLIALIFAAFYFLDPYSVAMVLTLSPEPLILFFYGLGLLVMGGFLKKNAGSWLGYLFAGIYVGIAGALDPICLTLLIFGFSVYHSNRGEAEGKWNRNVAVVLFLVLGTALGLLSGSGVWTVAHLEGAGKSFLELFAQWWGRFSMPSYLGAESFRLVFGGYPGTIFAVVVISLIILGIFGFFLQGRTERLSPWTAVLVILLGAAGFSFLPPMLPLASNSAMPLLQYNSGYLLIPCLYVLAGIGISGVVSPAIALASVESIVPKKQRDPITIHSIILSIRRKKEERKAALAYAVAHPETMEGKNPIVKFFYNRARVKAEKQHEIDKVMYALNSLSNDHVVLEDFTRDPYPEVSKDREGGLFHLRHHENAQEHEKQKENETKAPLVEKAAPSEKHVATENPTLVEESEEAEKTAVKESMEEAEKTAVKERTEEAEKTVVKESTAEAEKPAEAQKTVTSEKADTVREKPATSEMNDAAGDIEKSQESLELKKTERNETDTDPDKKAEADRVEGTENKEKEFKGKFVLFGRRKKEKMSVVGEDSEKDGSAEKNQSGAPESDSERTGTGAFEETGRRVALLDNPLPVPKKHVTSVMDYDYEVSDDDDYDIKDDD